MAEHLVLAPGDLQRLLLQRDQSVVILDEPDEVSRRADRQLAKVGAARRPRAEGQLPGQGNEGRRRAPQAQVRKQAAVGRRGGVRRAVDRRGPLGQSACAVGVKPT